jgi:hypothetical protein
VTPNPGFLAQLKLFDEVQRSLVSLHWQWHRPPPAVGDADGGAVAAGSTAANMYVPHVTVTLQCVNFVELMASRQKLHAELTGMHAVLNKQQEAASLQHSRRFWLERDPLLKVLVETDPSNLDGICLRVIVEPPPKPPALLDAEMPKTAALQDAEARLLARMHSNSSATSHHPPSTANNA